MRPSYLFSAFLLFVIGAALAFPQSPPDPHASIHQNLDLRGLFIAPEFKLFGVFARNNALHPASRVNQNYTSAPATPLIFTSPVFNQSIFDTATQVQTSTAQGDPYVTPVTRIISSDAGVNDTAPLYSAGEGERRLGRYRRYKISNRG